VPPGAPDGRGALARAQLACCLRASLFLQRRQVAAAEVLSLEVSGEVSEELLVRPERLELPTLCSEGRCSIQLSYGRHNAFYGKLGQRGNSLARKFAALDSTLYSISKLK
jgi:hypothetical protein